MPSSHNFERVYGPDTLKIMTTAFDNAHRCLPANLRENNQARRKLALLILRHIECGSMIQSVSLIRRCSISYDDYAARGLIRFMPEFKQCPLLAQSRQSDPACVYPLLDQSGQRWIQARDGLSANDPQRTSTLLCLVLLQRYRQPAHAEGGRKSDLSSLQLQNYAVRVL